jgi:predicted enzyme related to lactoylglutathione lyase
MLMMLAGWLSSAQAAPPMLPPISDPVSAERHAGKPIWLELVTPDLAVAERFYGTVFGWTFRSLPAGHVEYAVAMLGDRSVAGLVRKTAEPGEHRQSAWLTFLAVRDVNAAAGSALAHGAKVLAPARSYAARGRQVVLRDPEGAVFAMLDSQSGDPPDYLAAPGEWIWSSLQTTDPGADAAFYQAVFNYEIFDLPGDDSREHLILSSDGYARASINGLPADAAHRHPHWLNFVRVLDAGDAAARVKAAGGAVLVEPHPDRHGGRVAVVADPAGAPLGLLEWSSDESHEEPK